MGYRRIIGVVIALNFWVLGLSQIRSASDSVINKQFHIVQPFSLKSVSGEFVGMSTYPEAKGMIVVFTCNHCPFAKLYPERMNELHRKYAAKGIPLLAISSTDTVLFEEDGFAEMQKVAQQQGFVFPYLFDAEQTVVQDFGAQKTPHAFLLARSEVGWKIVYSGSIDDNGADPSAVKHKYVEDAVRAVLKHKKVKVAHTSSIGCFIHIRKN
jgi:peroxiredoxin